MAERYVCDEANAAQILGWLRERGGILVWPSINLANPGASWTTPALTEEGQPSTKPTWQAANEPLRHITEIADVDVCRAKELKRFHVAVRRGSQGMSLKVSDGGSRRIRSEVDKARTRHGAAWHVFDYDTQEAVIMIEDCLVPLREWAAQLEQPT